MPAPPAAHTATEAPLHVGTDPPLEPAAIARWIEPQIAEQLERAAWWPGPLGYAGAGPLEQLNTFRERTETARVFTSMTLGDVERLLRSSKLVTSARERKDGPGFWTAEQPRFLVAPYSESYPGSGWYRALKFRYTTPLDDELAEGLIEVMRRRRSFAEMTAADGRLVLEPRVLIEGGVTEVNLRAQLRHWRGFLATVIAVCRRMEENADDWNVCRLARAHRAGRGDCRAEARHRTRPPAAARL